MSRVTRIADALEKRYAALQKTEVFTGKES
jgi:hypothetical protein